LVVPLGWLLQVLPPSVLRRIVLVVLPDPTASVPPATQVLGLMQATPAS
jgi:hypothetical protein